MRAGLKATLACAKAFAITDFQPDLSAFTMPALIIHGNAYATVTLEANGLAAAEGIPQASLIEYDGDAYGLFATHEERLTTDLLTFLRGR